LQSAFHHPEANIKLLMPQYCAMFPDLEAYTQNGFGSTPETDAIAEEYLHSLAPGSIRIHEPYWDFMPIARALIGKEKTGLMGDDERLTLRHAMRTVKSLPPAWVIQGTDDVVVSFRYLEPSIPLSY
jgi:hypothetical protein